MGRSKKAAAMVAEAVKVIVRCRPMNTREKDLKCGLAVAMQSNIGQCSIKNPAEPNAPPKSFTFDGAYFIDSTTEQIYADIGFGLVEGVTDGFNGTIFAYGQTGCGKSFSMQGIKDPACQKGIIPRAFEHIFETIQVAENIKFLVHASYLEIYNEEIRDLLGVDAKKKLDLKEHPDLGIYCQGLSKHPCKSVQECENIMGKGWSNRAVGATLMNAESSRSHSIFTIYIERCDADESGEEHIRAAKLNLVDLAGSERQGKTGATGDRLKEATKINLSLSALGNVISALVDGKAKHIPYRDSKLTRMLQDSLGGNTKTLMVACLSPADNNYDETLSTLRYANRAKNIKNKPKINEDPKDAMLREYQDEIKKLKAMLRGDIPIDAVNLEGSSHSVDKGASKVAHPTIVEKTVVDPEAEQRVAEYQMKMEALQEDFESMRITNERLQQEVSKLQTQYDIGPDSANVEDGTSPGQAGLEVASVVSQDDDDIEFTKQKAGQKAVHLATSQISGSKVPVGQTDPKAAAEHEAVQEALRRPSVSNQAEAIQRLQELQQQMVGGEQSKNEKIKKKHKEKLKHVEERKKKLADALKHMDGEDIMLGIYDNVQDELSAKEKLLQKEKERSESLQREILDLQSEFEYDRIDYLDSIRKQDQQIKWLETVIERIHPCLRRDCNYVNLDRVKAQSVWTEEGKWQLPKLTIDKNSLPGVGGQDQKPEQRVYEGVEHDLRSEDRYLQKLQGRTHENNHEYFRPKRQETILNKMQHDKNRSIMTSKHAPAQHSSHGASGTLAVTQRAMGVTSPGGGRSMGGPTGAAGYGAKPMSGPVAGTMAGPMAGPAGGPVGGTTAGPGPASMNGSHSPSMNGSAGSGINRPSVKLTAAQVHGQLQLQQQEDMLIRKPVRLEALQHGSADKSKKRNKDPYF